MNDSPIDILRRLSEQKRLVRGVQVNEINEFNEITPPARQSGAPSYQLMGAACSEGLQVNEINEINEITRPATPAPKGRAADGASIVSPARWAGSASDEPPFEEPCPERRGLVERRGAVFLHFCIECGRWGAYGYGATLSQPGRWYCRLHRPA
jgi:hypothetical protein